MARYHIICQLYPNITKQQIITPDLIDLSLVGFNGEESKANKNGNNSINNDNEIVLWYRIKSDKYWQEYDLKTQKQIEIAFNNGDDIVILNENYAILFEIKSKSVGITNNSNVFHSTSNIRWKDSFTQYFYQKNLQSKKYRIVKRVNISQMQSYIESITNIVNDYF